MSDSASSQSLVCPKCGGAMRTYERSGITVDQCTECRGVFLDRGELERLIDAEGAANAPDDPARDRGDEGDQGAQKAGRKKRGGFLGDLFEMGD